MGRVRIAPPTPSATEREYDVLIEPGALGDGLAERVHAAAPAHRYALIADSNVADLLGDEVRDALEAGGLDVDLLRFPAGEAHKTRRTWTRLTDRMLELGIGRDGCVLALGGGVTGDLAGFVAATYMRGLPVVQLPTSLLAMVDASVGGKTAVDTPLGKNLVGAFHQPAVVIADPSVLGTLPDAELRTGLAEAVKHGAIADEAYLERIERDADRIHAREPAALVPLIERSVEIKAEFVAADPREAGARKALNFGHTVGHAIESLGGYDMLHGDAVAAGMVVEAEVGEVAGVTDRGSAAALRRVLRRVGLPTAPPASAGAGAIVEHARRDKKARGGRIHYTLIARIGRVARAADGAWALPLEDAIVQRVLARVTG